MDIKRHRLRIAGIVTYWCDYRDVEPIIAAHDRYRAALENLYRAVAHTFNPAPDMGGDALHDIPTGELRRAMEGARSALAPEGEDA